MTKKTKPTRLRRKTVYHVRNWSEYDPALVQRGSLTVWVSEDGLKNWRAAGPPQRGAQFISSAQAIEAMLILREVFHLTNRGAEGCMRSPFPLLQGALPMPDHTTLSRRGGTVQVSLPNGRQVRCTSCSTAVG
ncbi:transposase [Caldilinea sp.]|uniref:transposase n=1 Tax=Caldilinea sp. TaxID=2293560 RepID=UPI0026281E3E|nr:transposase [uncultured Caldilinea sp.]